MSFLEINSCKWRKTEIIRHWNQFGLSNKKQTCFCFWIIFLIYSLPNTQNLQFWVFYNIYKFVWYKDDTSCRHYDKNSSVTRCYGWLCSVGSPLYTIFGLVSCFFRPPSHSTKPQMPQTTGVQIELKLWMIR